MSKLHDFKDTFQRWAKATAADVLPTEALLSASERRVVRNQERAEARADRAHLSHKARGRLVFSSSLSSQDPRPLRLMKVQLWDRDALSPDDYLGEDVTDEDGFFEISYDPADAGFGDTPDLTLKVYDDYAGQEHLFFVIQGDDDVDTEDYDFGTRGVPWYEYHPEIPLPHILTFGFERSRFDAMPQSYTTGRKLALAGVASPMLAVRMKHYVAGAELSLAEIQADYRGKSTYRSPEGPGSEADADVLFVDKVLNSAGPCRFSEDPEGLLHVVYRWDEFDMDGKHRLPNVDACFRLDGDTLHPVSITLQDRLAMATTAAAPLKAPVVHRPGEHSWAEAKLRFLSTNYLYSQITNHLARGHFNVEQYALAAWRNLRESPLKALLFPHLKEVMIINTEGESAIFGPDGIVTKNSGLTSPGLVAAIQREASIDWWGFAPRQPLTPGHRFAHVANLVWEAIGEHVDTFFAENLDGIVASWDEAVGMSDDLVSHAVSYVPRPLPEGHTWRCPREEARPEAPRREVGGRLRTMTPFATGDAPSAEALADLASACRYAIFHATFWHSWVNDTTDALEPHYTQYAPVSESTPKELTDHISLNLCLSQTRYGLVLANEDGDVPPTFRQAILDRAEQLRAYGFEPRNLRSRINI